MKKAIYKYENKINHKIYIGQTNNPERRYKEHLSRHSKSTSLLEKAILKYGIKNFNYEIIEWTEDYDNREQYWIDFYNSYKPNGYNIAKGGGFLPNQKGENHSQSTISEETARKIQTDLMNWKIPKRQIIKKYNSTQKVVESICSGHTWNYYNLNYPLRPTETELNNMKALEIIKMLRDTNLSIKEIASEVGWGESQIKMINQGANHHQDGIKYPLRANPKDYSNKVEICIELLKQGKKNTEISNILETSVAWVSRVNNGKIHKNPNIKYPIRK